EHPEREQASRGGGGSNGYSSGPSSATSVAATVEGGSILGRAQFSADEMEALQERFNQLDIDGYSKISEQDLKEVLARLGYADVDDSTIAGVLNEVDVAQKEYLQLDQFLDAVAASKDASIENAFTMSV
ncbi:hypothetical protein CF326_g7973, partial [Tilletia indica]